MKARLTALAGLLLSTLTAYAATDSLAEASRFMESGNYRAALERLRPATPFPKEQVKARFLYATALAGTGEREKAIEMLEALIADYPEYPEPYNNLAALWAGQGQLEKAKEVLERGMRTSASYAAVHDNLSSIYVEMARASYAKALRVPEAAHTPNLHVLYAMSGLPPPPVETVVVAAAEPALAEPKSDAKPAAVKPVPAPETKPAPVARPAPTPVPAAAPVVSKPVPAPAAAPAPNAGSVATPQAAVVATLQEWTRVWSARDVEGYLGFYAADFKPVRQSRARWVAERRDRLTNSQSITVTLEEPKVQMVGASRAIVNVVQQYSSANYSDRTRKQLVLVKVGERWLIHSEKTLGVLH